MRVRIYLISLRLNDGSTKPQTPKRLSLKRGSRKSAQRKWKASTFGSSLNKNMICSLPLSLKDRSSLQMSLCLIKIISCWPFEQTPLVFHFSVIFGSKYRGIFVRKLTDLDDMTPERGSTLQWGHRAIGKQSHWQSAEGSTGYPMSFCVYVCAHKDVWCHFLLEKLNGQESRLSNGQPKTQCTHTGHSCMEKQHDLCL